MLEHLRRQDNAVRIPFLDPRRAAHPAAACHYGRTYDPAWLRGQFRLACVLLGWARDGRIIHPGTGEIVPEDADARVYLALLLDEAPPSDPLLAEARRLGAVVSARRRKDG